MIEHHKKHINQISEPDIMWLAGLLEGEGCFDETSTKTPRVRLCMTDPDVVDRASVIIGTHVANVRTMQARTERHLSKYSLDINGIPALELMERLLLQMGGRRSTKIRELLRNRHSRYV